MIRMSSAVGRRAIFTIPVIIALGCIAGWLGNPPGPDNPWFAVLAKPALFPAPMLFLTVLLILFVMVGLALAIVLAAPPSRAKVVGLALFVVQLALNFLWTPTFFAAHRMAAALEVLIVLDFVVLMTTIAFFGVSRRAGWLFAPCLAWVLFGSYLNYALVIGNPASLEGEEGPTVATAGAIAGLPPGGSGTI